MAEITAVEVHRVNIPHLLQLLELVAETVTPQAAMINPPVVVDTTKVTGTVILVMEIAAMDLKVCSTLCEITYVMPMNFNATFFNSIIIVFNIAIVCI